MKYLLLAPPKEGVRGLIESPPVGLGYVATALRSIGQEVEIKDCIIENWDNWHTTIHINNTRPDIVGINLFSTGLNSVKDLVMMIRSLNYYPLILLGGPHVTGTPYYTLKYFSEADYAIWGEGEIPIVEFDEFLKGKRTKGDVGGLVWRQGKKIITNPMAECQNVDDLGFPAWDLIDPKKYFKEYNVGDKSSTIHFSRGCPFRCTFCVHLGQRVRFHSLEHIWEEIELLNRDYGVIRFVINDEAFTVSPTFEKKFIRFLQEKKSKYKFFTSMGIRLNRVDDELLSLMKANNFELSFGAGIESAVPRVRQELIKKDLTQEDMIKGLKLLNKYGFQPVGNFILGYPGETKAEARQSVDWACKTDLLWGANFVPFLPLPGAQIVKEMIARGEFPEDFDFSKNNVSNVVYAPQGWTLKDVDDLRRYAVWKFNTKPKLLWHYFSNWERFKRAVLIFMRIFFPGWLLPKGLRRRE